MQVKVNFKEINVKEEKEKTLVKVLMLKGEKGDSVSAEWGTITGNLENQTDLKNALDSKANQSEVTQALNQKANTSDLNNYYNKSQMNTALGSKIGTEDIVDTLDSTSSDKVLSASQGKLLNDNLKKKVYFFDTVALMKSSIDLLEGDMIITKGYYSANDGGAGEYEVLNDNTLVDDGGSVIDLQNGLKAKLIIEDKVNIKQFGAKGDGTTDETNVFNKAIEKFNTIFIPKGQYKLNTKITLNKNTYIYGDSTIKTWSGETPLTQIISPASDYAFKCSWGNVNKFENLTFVGYGIDEPCGTQITNCEFTGVIGINNARISTISKCSFHNCTTSGIKKLTDSKVIDNFIYNNEIGIDMSNSNDNIISNNKIEWNSKGIYINTAVFNIINNNIFDRSTTYGIDGTNIAYLQIMNNQFERNLTNHIRINGSQIAINDNNLYAKKSLDDGTGELLPNNALYTPSISNSTIKNNIINAPLNGKMFEAYPDYNLNNIIENNMLNGLNTTYFGKSLGNITVNANSSSTFTFSWSNLAYLGLNGYDVEIIDYYIENDTSKYKLLTSDNIKVYYHQNNGFTVEITNNTENNITYNIYVNFKNKSPFKVKRLS